MITSRGLNHINLNVNDIERSLRFYEQALGLQVEFWEGGRSMVFLRSPGANDTITLCQAHPGDPVAGGGVSHFGFRIGEISEIDEAIKQIERAGGRLLSRGEHAPGVTFAYVADPDGYVIELGRA